MRGFYKLRLIASSLIVAFLLESTICPIPLDPTVTVFVSLVSFRHRERESAFYITGVENETSQTMLIQFKAAPKRIELQKRA